MTSSAALTSTLDLHPTDHAQDSLHYPVIFRNVQYSSASEALDAYIRDYDGQLGRPVRTDVDSLLTDNIPSGRSYSELEKLVDESYEKLQSGDATTSQGGLSHNRLLNTSLTHPHFSTPHHSSLLNGHSTYPGAQLPSVGLDGHRAPPSWVEEAARSDVSSIISGHLLKRPTSGTVLVSTPRKSGRPGGLGDVSTGPLSLSDLGGGDCSGDLKIPGKSTIPSCTDQRAKSSFASHDERGKPSSGSHNNQRQSSGVSDIENEQHRQYLLSLVRDIEQTSSDVVLPRTGDVNGELKTVEDKPSNRTVHFQDDEVRSTSADVGSTEWVLPQSPPQARVNGVGYMDRIQHLISSDSSPTSPSEQHTADHTMSPVTSVETERTWERLPPVRSPAYTRDGGDVDEAASHIMEECLSIVSQHDQTEAETLSGGSHPGGMEALKNMLFTIQSMSHTVNDNTDKQPPSHSTQKSNPTTNSHESDTTSLHTSTSSNPSTLNTTSTTSHRDQKSKTRPDSGQSMTSSGSSSNSSKPYNKAMEHITKLKTLIDFNSSSTPP